MAIFPVALVTVHSALQTSLTNIRDNSNLSSECIQICKKTPITLLCHSGAHQKTKQLAYGAVFLCKTYTSSNIAQRIGLPVFSKTEGNPEGNRILAIPTYM